MTTAECIHGLDPALCDVCSPRTPVEVIPPPRVATPRGTSTRGSRAPSRVPGASTLAPINLATHRVAHFTHLDTLEAIVADGELRAGANPVVDLSSGTARELRATVDAPGGGSVADRVCFFASPDSTRWSELRSGAEGPLWSDAARATKPADFALLITSLSELGEDTILTDGDAASASTRFAVSADDQRAMLRRLTADGGRIADAELLASPHVGVDVLTLIGVANEPVRDRVRAMLTSVGLHVRVAVHPPWFQND